VKPRPGERITFDVQRSGKVVQIPITPATTYQITFGAGGGLKEADVVTGVDGRSLDDLGASPAAYADRRRGKPVTLALQREMPQRSVVHISLTLPATGRDAAVHALRLAAKQGMIGIVFDQNAVIRHVRPGPLGAVEHGANRTAVVLTSTWHYLTRIFRGRESGDQLSGPLGMFQATGSVTREAAEVKGPLVLRLANVGLTWLQFIALISIGIGFLNLLPIPILDGGHLLFYAYEAVARKPLGARVQELGYQVGLALLLGLMLFATWNDLQKQSVFEKILGGLFS
jgi:regulator of sigma E protease